MSMSDHDVIQDVRQVGERVPGNIAFVFVTHSWISQDTDASCLQQKTGVSEVANSDVVAVISSTPRLFIRPARQKGPKPFGVFRINTQLLFQVLKGLWLISHSAQFVDTLGMKRDIEL